MPSTNFYACPIRAQRSVSARTAWSLRGLTDNG